VRIWHPARPGETLVQETLGPSMPSRPRAGSSRSPPAEPVVLGNSARGLTCGFVRSRSAGTVMLFAVILSLEHDRSTRPSAVRRHCGDDCTNEVDILVLRHQLAAPRRQVARPDLNRLIRLCWRRCRVCTILPFQDRTLAPALIAGRAIRTVCVLRLSDRRRSATEYGPPGD
jgi:hypothetical protein